MLCKQFYDFTREYLAEKFKTILALFLRIKTNKDRLICISRASKYKNRLLFKK